MPRANFSVFFAAAALCAAAASSPAQAQQTDGPQAPPPAAPGSVEPHFPAARLASLDTAGIPSLPGFGSRQADEDPVLLCDGENVVIDLFPRQCRSQSSPSQQP